MLTVRTSRSLTAATVRLRVFHRTALCLVTVLAWSACGDDDATHADAEHGGHGGTEAAPASSGSGGKSGAGGSGGNAGSTGGAGGRASPLACEQKTVTVTCGGETCPATTEIEQNRCSVPCCAMFEGKERCGFRGTARGFTTECVLPATPDPTCDEVPQFQGCCEPTQHVCGIIGGFAPGCQTKSNFVTLPANPKKCGPGSGATDEDAGT